MFVGLQVPQKCQLDRKPRKNIHSKTFIQKNPSKNTHLALIIQYFSQLSLNQTLRAGRACEIRDDEIRTIFKSRAGIELDRVIFSTELRIQSKMVDSNVTRPKMRAAGIQPPSGKPRPKGSPPLKKGRKTKWQVEIKKPAKGARGG